MMEIAEIVHTKKEIEKKRQELALALVRESKNLDGEKVRSISAADLHLMFELYDRFFLYDWFKYNYKGKMKFSLSKRMTKSAGVTLCPKNVGKIRQEELVVEIRIGIDLIFQYGAAGGSRNVCGIRVNNSLDALLLVFEHELCHAIEFILYKKSSCKGKRFGSLAFRLFGHTERYHALPTVKQVAMQRLSKRVGDMVTFSYKGQEFKGLIYSINKRAAVMVRDADGRYSDRHGIRYAKYYIPLSLLK